MQCKMPSSSVLVISLQLSVVLLICSGVTRAAILRCQCIKTVSVLKSTDKSQIMNVEIINSGPYCPRVEVIVTYRNGREDCLNPEVKWVKRMISNLLRKKGIKNIVNLQQKN